jgi:hypothetical protein
MGNELQVSLGGIHMVAGYGYPAPGEWMLTLAELENWWERATDGTETTPHWSGAGQQASSTSTPGRQITTHGMLLATADHGPGSLAAALGQIRRLFRTQLVVAEDDLVRVVDVRVLKPQHTRLTPTSALLTLSLVADDPLCYSAESRTLANGANLLPNRGDVTAFGRLALTGPHGAISITHPGGVWTFPALASGSRLVDFRELAVWNGNVRVFGASAGPAPRVLSSGSSWTVSGLGVGTAILSRCEAWS